MKKFIILTIVLIISFNIDVWAVNNPNKIYKSKQNFIRDYYINGSFFEMNETFKIEEWNIKKATLDLSFNSTPFTDSSLSSCTFALNGEKFYSIKINNNDSQKQILTINIPIENIIEGVNTITISAYMTIGNESQCADDIIPSNWLNVSKDSCISIDYELNRKIDTIADFYKNFTSINSLDYKQSVFAVNDTPDCDELTAAFTALFGISRNAYTNYQNIGFGDISSGENIIYISKYSKLNENIVNYLTEEQKQSALNSAVMVLIKKGTFNILVVTSDNNIALNSASSLISNQEAMMQINKIDKIITANEDVYMRTKNEWQYIELTPKGNYVTGPFRQTIEYYIDYPKNRTIADFSELYLNFRYSENLNFERSLVSVYINDIPIGSKKLSQASAQTDEFLFKIPIDTNISGSFNLKVAFDLEIKDLWCTLRQEEMPWAYISNKSMLKLNWIQNPVISFNNYPAPFIKDGSLNKIAFVIPDNINDINYVNIVPLILTMGQYLKDNNGELKVISASEIENLNDYNIITIGTFKNNSFIRNLNDKLFFKFSSDGNNILSNEKMLIDKDYSTQLGTSQLLKSPFSSGNNALLVISGVTDESIYNSVKYITSSENLWRLSGDAYVADYENIFVYSFEQNNNNKLSFDNRLSERNDLTLFSIVALMIIVLIIFSIAFIINKYNKLNRRNKK